jgi:signal transduction histidine kinase
LHHEVTTPLPCSEAQEQLLRYRRRSLVFGACLVAGCYGIDLFQPNLVPVALLRAAWVGLILLGAALQRPERPRLAQSAALITSIATGLAVVAIVALDGGTRSIYGGMLIATPFAVLVVMVELPLAAALTGLVCVVGGAAIRAAEGQRPVDIACWLLLSLIMTALATWGTVAARRAWRIEVAAEQERGHAIARLAEAERLAEIGRLAAQVAHEVNNPLAAVRSNVQWLSREGSAGGEQAEVLGETLAGLDRIAGAVAQLQGVARTAGSSEVEEEPGARGRPALRAVATRAR